MWLTRLKIKNDCTIGSRCEKFSCTAYSIPLGNWKDKNLEYAIERHIIVGSDKDVATFLLDLKTDKRIRNLEISKNAVFFVERRKRKEIPSFHWNPRIFFIKPVFVDNKGFEYWEIA